jgi:hypothetical protein
VRPATRLDTDITIGIVTVDPDDNTVTDPDTADAEILLKFTALFIP